MKHKRKHMHFIGIGGIGMSGVALIALDQGHRISGSDEVLNNLTEKISARGGAVSAGHRPENLGADVDVVVYSSSITSDNPEMIAARGRGIPCIQRAQALAELFNVKEGIAVTGSHGKTTTTSMIAVVCEYAGLDPTVAIGGEVEQFKGNAKSGAGSYFVAEADESDGSFVHFMPRHAVITNVEREHLDYYHSLDEIHAAYRAFADNVRTGGCLFYNQDDANLQILLRAFKGRTATFGTSSAALVYPRDIVMDKFRTTYTCMYRGKEWGAVTLAVPGVHNVLNSLAAILVGIECGIEPAVITNALATFCGTKRRFHLRAEADGALLIDDYAHHPTEIRAVIAACRNWPYQRLIVVFQPHRYTRTLHLADEFGRCFTGADMVLLTDIYAASEAPIEGVSVAMIHDRIRRHGQQNVSMMEKEAIADHLLALKRRGDIVLILGAGDIKEVADDLALRWAGGK